MSERNVNIQDEEVVRTLQSSLELELSELRSLHEAQADDLHEAFSPGVINLLRRLSEDDAFFQYPTPDDSSSSSDTMSQSHPASDYWKATRMTFKFLCDEFMPAPKDQQMGRFQAFLEQVRGTASRIRLPGGASMSPDQNVTLRQCVTAVKTMKEVLGSKFTSLQKYVRMQMEQGQEGRYFADAHHTADSHITPGFHTRMNPTDAPQRESASPFAGAQQNSPIVPGFATGMSPSDVPQRESASGARHESIFRYSGTSNPEVSRVIRENPIFTRGAGDTQGLTRTGVIVTSVIRTIQETPAHSTLQTAPEQVDQGGSSRTSRPKRKPLKRQSHVVEED